MSDTSDSSSSEGDNETLQELCNKLSKLKPYDFEPLASSDESDEDEEEEEEIEDHSEAKNTNQRKGNTNWCLCGCCKLMGYERECWCCQEANEIADELFEGLYFFILLKNNV